ncbi:MAG: desulfoferrodoxin [Victivallales bacterium]|nr:desulfoferrodoxin [Victivallales bacterium]
MSEKRERNEVYKCDVCGNVVEILNGTKAPIICCGQEMRLEQEKTQDAKAEKHVPVINEKECCSKVQVGEKPHPMEEEHYIQWVEIINGNYVNRKYLHPGDNPEAEFYVSQEPKMKVRAYCNIHGLWSNK